MVLLFIQSMSGNQLNSSNFNNTILRISILANFMTFKKYFNPLAHRS